MPKNQINLPVPDLDWYRDVVERAPETIIIVDCNGTILFHNSQSEGFDPSYFVGKPIFEFFLPEYYETVREKLEKVFKTGQQEHYELATNYSKAEVRWYATRLGPIIRNGQVVAASLFIRNTTDLKRTEQTLNRSNEDLEKRVIERTQVLQEYAHRLEASERLNASLRQAGNRLEVIEILAGYVFSMLEADLVGVYQFKEDQLHYSLSLGHTDAPPDVLTQKDDPLLYHLLESDKICAVPIQAHIEQSCRFCNYIYTQKMRSLLVAPLRTGSTVVGVLYVGFLSAREHSLEDGQLLNMFVESASNTLHRILVTEQLEQHIQQRDHELRVLYEVMSTASDVLDEESLLKKSLNITLQAVKCQIGVIHLIDRASQKLKLTAQEGLSEELYNWLQLSGTSGDLWEKVYHDEQVVQARQMQTQSYHETTGPGVAVLTYLGVLIRAKEVPLGVLSIFGQDDSLLEPGVKQLMSTIADQIGLALESTHQRQREKETLILEERQRLARELHDSVSQSLYGLVLSADVGNKLLKLKAYSKLSETLAEIGEVALQSLKEMRLMLFELRPLSLEGIGLIGALELRLNTVERRAGMETSLEVNGKEYLPKSLDLEIYRIAAEALNNSLKHARASAVRVSISASEDHLELVIVDDGKGFERVQKQAGGIGLSSMKERSLRMGGTLTIDSIPNSGTRIYLVVPLMNRAETGQEAA